MRSRTSQTPLIGNERISPALTEDKFAKEFGLVDSFISDKYQSKDFSDLVKNYGKEKANHILLYETLLPF